MFWQQSCAPARDIPPGLLSCPGVIVPGEFPAGIFCGICPRPSDHRVCRSCAAKLGRVKPDSVSAWIKRKHLTDVQYEGSGKRKRPWFNALEVITVSHKLQERERARQDFLAGGIPEMDEAVA